MSDPTDIDPDKTPGSGYDLGGQAFTGAAFMIATRFAVRLLGLVSVTVLARLLTPADFGLFGTAALILGFFFLLREIGFSEAVIKEVTLEKEDIDTLWTMRLILSLITGSAIFITAPVAASFLQDDRVTLLLYIMSAIPIIDALASPASSLLLRELNYKTDFLLKSSNKVIQVTAVITVALILKSYWALVFGAILSSISGVIITHIVRPYRPRLSLSRLRKHVDFAAWSYVKSLSLYFANTADEIIVRSAANTAFFGIYHISRDLCRVLISDLIGPVREAMLPALSQMSTDKKRHAAATANIFGAAMIVATAIALGITITAPQLVYVLLGDQWHAAAPLVSLLAVGCACNAIGEINMSSFATTGRQREAALFWTIRAATYGTGCFLAGHLFSTAAIALTFSALSLLVLIIETRYLFIKLGAAASLTLLCLRPLAAGSVMTSVIWILPIPDSWPAILILVAEISVGGVVYCLTLLLIWKLNGFKDGPEHTLYSNLPIKIRKLLPLKIAIKRR